ncbi:MAG: hypothetical protein Q8N79_03455, partial [Candidatus Methanoperedens sp.]|nr:hypothetical protein [Candidatus Methanoperedens sp.]
GYRLSLGFVVEIKVGFLHTLTSGIIKLSKNYFHSVQIATAGERNKMMKHLDKKCYGPAPSTVEISRYQKYGELLKNSVGSYPLLDMIVLVMKDMAWVEQAVVGGEK